MNITYLYQYFNTLAMSGGTRSFEMARRLVEAGHNVNLVTSRRTVGRRRWTVSNEAGINVHWFPIEYSNRMGYRRRIRAFVEFAVAATARAASLPCDVVYASSTPLTIALPGAAVARRQRVPMVFEVRDLWPAIPIAVGAIKHPFLRWGTRRMEAWAYARSEAVVALSPGMRDGVVAAGYPRQRVAVVPNASDIGMFASGRDGVRSFRDDRPWIGDRPFVLYAGTFGRVNDVEWLVPVASHLLAINPEIRILLIGDGARREALTEQAAAAGVLDSNLFVEGRLSKMEMPSAFAAATIAANIFVDVPALQANSANKFFDALAAGIPVLLNFRGWQADLVEAAGAGLVVQRGRPQEAAGMIARAITDAQWLQRAGSAALRLAKERFDRDVLARQLERVLVAAYRRTGEQASSIAPWADTAHLSSLPPRRDPA